MRLPIKLLLLLLFVPSAIYAQIEVIETSEDRLLAEHSAGNQVQYQLHEVTPIDEGEPYYTLTYKDYRYPNIYALESLMIPNRETLDDLKRLILEGFESDERTFEKFFEINDELVTLVKQRQLRSSYISIWVENKGHSRRMGNRGWTRFWEQVEEEI